MVQYVKDLGKKFGMGVLGLAALTAVSCGGVGNLRQDSGPQYGRRSNVERMLNHSTSVMRDVVPSDVNGKYGASNVDLRQSSVGYNGTYGSLVKNDYLRRVADVNKDGNVTLDEANALQQGVGSYLRNGINTLNVAYIDENGDGKPERSLYAFNQPISADVVKSLKCGALDERIAQVMGQQKIDMGLGAVIDVAKYWALAEAVGSLFEGGGGSASASQSTAGPGSSVGHGGAVTSSGSAYAGAGSVVGHSGAATAATNVVGGAGVSGAGASGGSGGLFGFWTP